MATEFNCNKCGMSNTLHPTNVCYVAEQLMPAGTYIEDVLMVMPEGSLEYKMIEDLVKMTEPEANFETEYDAYIVEAAHQRGFEIIDSDARLLVVHSNDLVKFVKEQRGVPMTPPSPQTVAQIMDEAHNKLTSLFLASSAAPATEKPPFTKFQKDALYKVTKYLAVRKEMGRPNGFIHGWYLEDRSQNVNLMEADLQTLVDALRERL